LKETSLPEPEGGETTMGKLVIPGLGGFQQSSLTIVGGHDVQILNSGAYLRVHNHLSKWPNSGLGQFDCQGAGKAG